MTSVVLVGHRNQPDDAFEVYGSPPRHWPQGLQCLLSPFHIERGKARLLLKLTLILLHRHSEIHSFIAVYGFILAKCLLVVIVPKVEKPNLFSVIDKS